MSEISESVSRSFSWERIDYPESDGEPLAETDTHYRQITDLRFSLEQYCIRKFGQVYVAANLFLYYVEGDPRKVLAPDIFVVLGVLPGDRRIFRLWEEGKGPDVVFEITSKSTRIDDIGNKKGLYEALGVSEYFLFDPLHEYMEPQLKGYRLEEGLYRPIAEIPLICRTLGLLLKVDKDKHLRLFELGSEAPLPTPLEEAERAEREAERAEREARARLKLEEEVERLKKKLAEAGGR